MQTFFSDILEDISQKVKCLLWYPFVNIGLRNSSPVKNIESFKYFIDCLLKTIKVIFLSLCWKTLPHGFLHLMLLMGRLLFEECKLVFFVVIAISLSEMV